MSHVLSGWAAARGGDFERLLQLLAPDAVVGADEAAVLAGTPASIEGRDEVAAFFNGSAQASMAVFVGDRPASGHSIIGLGCYGRGTREVVALGRCWSRGRLLSWLAAPS